jgi:pteridine reductase
MTIPFFVDGQNSHEFCYDPRTMTQDRDAENRDHRVAIVTGGAARIGRAISLALAREKLRVCLHYGSSQDAAEQTADEIRKAGGEVTLVQADLADPASAAETIVDGALQAFGRVDVLINNASIFEPATLSDLSADHWQRHQAINLTAPVFLCQRFAAAVRQQDNPSAAIINLADWRALQPQSGHLAYTLSKAGLVALTKLLAQELAPAIRVNAIAPGAILPPAGVGDDYEQRMSSVIPLRRTGGLDDITAAVRFLLGTEFITGEILHITGGQQLQVPVPKGT